MGDFNPLYQNNATKYRNVSDTPIEKSGPHVKILCLSKHLFREPVPDHRIGWKVVQNFHNIVVVSWSRHQLSQFHTEVGIWQNVDPAHQKSSSSGFQPLNGILFSVLKKYTNECQSAHEVYKGSKAQCIINHCSELCVILAY